jgi:hypothetical protein
MVALAYIGRIAFDTRCAASTSKRLLTMSNCSAREHRRGDISVTSVKICLLGASGPHSIDVSV